MLKGIILLCAASGACDVIPTSVRAYLPHACFRETIEASAKMDIVKDHLASGGTVAYRCDRERFKP
jgi:hypothetical protein